MKRINPKKNLIKTSLILIIFYILTWSSTIILTSYPQHLYLDNITKINNIQFSDNNIVSIKGLQSQYNTGDSIFLDGKEYIKITGNQKQYGNSIYTPAIRFLSDTITQNVLIEREIGSFNINSQSSQLIINSIQIKIIPLSQNIINIQSGNSNYNVEVINNKTYLTFEKDIMLKLEKNNNFIIIYILGFSEYENIKMRII